MNQNSNYDANQRPLVPQAERAFIPVEERETVQETVWFNPTDKDAILDLYVGVTPCRSIRAKQQFRAMSKLQQKEFRTGVRRYIIRAGQRRAIHSDFDGAIQSTTCLEQECTSRAMYCRDSTHHKMVIGGLGPQLVNEAVQHRPVVHPALIEADALQKQAEEEARKFLEQKKIAEQSMAVAFVQAERAREMTAAAKAIEEKNAAVAGSPVVQSANPPAGGQKKDK